MNNFESPCTQTHLILVIIGFLSQVSHLIYHAFVLISLVGFSSFIHKLCPLN